MAFLPKPGDDELLYSTLARYSLVLGLNTTTPLLRSAFGKRVDQFRVMLPGDLDFFASTLPTGVHLTSTNLLEQHTVEPYFSRFLSPADYAMVRSQMRRGWVKGRYHGAPLLNGGVQWPLHMRVCQVCAEADAEAHGVATWRRVHQLPGVFVCPTHEMPLLKTGIATKAQSRLIVCEVPKTAKVVEPLLEASVAVRVAKASYWLLRNPGAPIDVGAAQRAMRSLIVDNAWLGRNNCAKPGFLEALESYYGTRELRAMGVTIGSSTSRVGAQRLWGRAVALPHSPLPCLLVLDFLNTGPQELFARARREMTKQSAPVNKRPNRPRELYLERHKEEILAAIRSEPKITRVEVRRRSNTAYCYLNRNDPGWLSSNLPPRQLLSKSSIDWKVRSKTLLAILEQTVHALRAETKSCRKITFAKLAARLGLRSVLFRSDPRLNAVRAAMNNFIREESRQ